MFYCILYFLCIMLILTGMFFIFYIAALKKELTDSGYFIAVEAFEENTKLPQQVFSAFIQINLFNFSCKKPVYVIDRNLSEETRDMLCRSLEPYGKIIFIKADSKEKLFE